MSRYYRVKQDTFMWQKGAILKKDPKLGSNTGGYVPISDVWDACDLNGEYISATIIEAPENDKYFERVYKLDEAGKQFTTREAAKAVYEVNAEELSDKQR